MRTLLIEMQTRGEPCAVCGAETDGRHGVPMYEGRVVSNYWEGEWGGFDACLDCFDKQQAMEPEVTEPDYSI